MDIKAARQKYDCREEIGKLLSGPNRTNTYLCPYHDEKTPSFHVYQDGFKCFGCGEFGDIFDFWSLWYGKPASEFWREHNIDPLEEAARKQAHLEREAKRIQTELEKLAQVLEEMRSERAWERYHEQVKETGLAEWAKRGVPEWYVDYAYLGYDPAHTFWIGAEYTTPTLTFPVFGYPDQGSAEHQTQAPIQPFSGDLLQFIKAGVMEIPDVLAVNKADDEGLARKALADVKAALSYEKHQRWSRPVLAVSAATNLHLTELDTAIRSHYEHLSNTNALRQKRMEQTIAWALGGIRYEVGERGLQALGGAEKVREFWLTQPPHQGEIRKLTALLRTVQWRHGENI